MPISKIQKKKKFEKGVIFISKKVYKKVITVPKYSLKVPKYIMSHT